MTRRRFAVVSVALAAVVLTGTGIAWASGITLTSKKLGAAAVTTPVMFPVSVAFINVSGAGKAANSDKVVFTFSQPILPSTLCAGWNGVTNLTFKWAITNVAGGNDRFAPVAGTNPCAAGLNMGAVDLGSTGYNTSTNGTIVDFNGAHVLSSNNTVLTITLSGVRQGASAGTVATGSAATWTPSTLLTDTSGRNCGANLGQSSTTVQF